MNELQGSGVLALDLYEEKSKKTDLMGAELETPVLGLFGEVGSLLAVLKKRRRDRHAFARYESALSEELGDVLWYLAAVARRVDARLSQLFDDGSGVRPQVFRGISTSIGSANDVVSSMMALAARVGELAQEARVGSWDARVIASRLGAIAVALVHTANAANIDLEKAAAGNLRKIAGRWAQQSERAYVVAADDTNLVHERLPRKFEIKIEEHTVGKRSYVIQSMNGVIIGDRLTDNKSEPDDYRFHDVFHIANAVHLGWSPVLRALLKVKRKARPEIDENQDGARAILIEEGIATLVFNRAPDDLYAGRVRVDPDLLKLIQELVKGYEPEQCNLWQWEEAILDGFRAFRHLADRRRGLITADLTAHTLTFSPLRV